MLFPFAVFTNACLKGSHEIVGGCAASLEVHLAVRKIKERIDSDVPAFGIQIASTDHEGITVTWTAVEACQSYCVEMRSNSGLEQS